MTSGGCFDGFGPEAPIAPGLSERGPRAPGPAFVAGGLAPDAVAAVEVVTDAGTERVAVENNGWHWETWDRRARPHRLVVRYRDGRQRVMELGQPAKEGNRP